MLCSKKQKQKSENSKSAETLETRTSFNHDEIEALKEKFFEISKGSKIIQQNKINDLQLVLPVSGLFSKINQRIVIMMKKNKSYITFEDYVLFMNKFLNGTKQEKAQISFQFIAQIGYDFFTEYDLKEFVGEVLMCSTNDMHSFKNVDIISEKLFKKMDTKRDGKIHFDEFQNYFINDQNVFNLISIMNEELLQGFEDSQMYQNRHIINKVIFIENILKLFKENIKNHKEIKPETKINLKKYQSLQINSVKDIQLQDQDSLIQNKDLIQKNQIHKVNRCKPFMIDVADPDKQDESNQKQIEKVFQYEEKNLKYVENRISDILCYVEDLKDSLIQKGFQDLSTQNNSNQVFDNIPKIKQQHFKSTVFFFSKNWNLVINMMLGIQQSVKALQKYHNQIIDYDFTYKTKFDLTQAQKFFQNKNKNKNKNIFKRCIFSDYNSYVFQTIRDQYGIGQDDYIRSIGADNLVLNLIKGELKSFSQQTSQGKSGSFFFFSNDGNFVLKTIKKKESKFLRKILKNYYNHLLDNKNSFINKIFGHHKIVFQKSDNSKRNKTIYFIIMNNSFNTPLFINERFDLKGSLHGRLTKTKNKQIAKKDQNFLNENFKFNLDEPHKKQFLKILQKDCEFFKQNHIIDYSLLLGVHKTKIEPDKKLLKNYKTYGGKFISEDKKFIYFISIIDFLTEYTLSKKTEHAFQSLLFGNTISAIPTEKYSKRFYEFIAKSLDQFYQNLIRK